jgi:hypothetical protein
MIHRSIRLVMAVLAWLATSQIASVQAQSVSDVVVQNGSSGMPGSTPQVERYFETGSTLGPVHIDDTTHSFTHRLAFHNSLVAGGGVAQVNKRNVIYQLTFTVDDPLGVGYQIDLTSVLRGVSSITQTSGSQSAFATGLLLGASYGIDTTDPAEFTNFSSGLYGQNTPGVSVSGEGTAIDLQESIVTSPLGDGVFVGTSTFSLHFTSVPTPTTNVVFQNESLGEGFVNYGLGSDVGDLEVSTDDLGHFLTIDVTFNADAVATAAETWSGVKSLFR